MLPRPLGEGRGEGFRSSVFHPPTAHPGAYATGLARLFRIPGNLLTCSQIVRLPRPLGEGKGEGLRFSILVTSLSLTSPPSCSPGLAPENLKSPEISLCCSIRPSCSPNSTFPRPLGEGRGEGMRFRSSILQRRIPGLTPPGSPDYSAFLATCSLAHKLSGSLAPWERAMVTAPPLSIPAPKKFPPVRKGGPGGGARRKFHRLSIATAN
jgi:hypothetical protein